MTVAPLGSVCTFVLVVRRMPPGASSSRVNQLRARVCQLITAGVNAVIIKLKPAKDISEIGL